MTIRKLWQYLLLRNFGNGHTVAVTITPISIMKKTNQSSRELIRQERMLGHECITLFTVVIIW